MAAGATYTPIASTTVSGGSTTTVTFSSISGYTDIILITNFGADSGSRQPILRVNGATSTYSSTTLSGDGTTATSGRLTGYTGIYLNKAAYAPTTLIANSISHFMNYANASTYKTILSRYNSSSGETVASVGLWSSTSAITSVSFLLDAGNILSGSTFALYGIAAA